MRGPRARAAGSDGPGTCAGMQLRELCVRYRGALPRRRCSRRLDRAGQRRGTAPRWAGAAIRRARAAVARHRGGAIHYQRHGAPARHAVTQRVCASRRGVRTGPATAGGPGATGQAAGWGQGKALRGRRAREAEGGGCMGSVRGWGGARATKTSTLADTSSRNRPVLPAGPHAHTHIQSHAHIKSRTRTHPRMSTQPAWPVSCPRPAVPTLSPYKCPASPAAPHVRLRGPVGPTSGPSRHAARRVLHPLPALPARCRGASALRTPRLAPAGPRLSPAGPRPSPAGPRRLAQHVRGAGCERAGGGRDRARMWRGR